MALPNASAREALELLARRENDRMDPDWFVPRSDFGGSRQNMRNNFKTNQDIDAWGGPEGELYRDKMYPLPDRFYGPKNGAPPELENDMGRGAFPPDEELENAIGDIIDGMELDPRQQMIMEWMREEGLGDTFPEQMQEQFRGLDQKRNPEYIPRPEEFLDYLPDENEEIPMY